MRKWTGRPGVHIDVGGEGRYPDARNVSPDTIGIHDPGLSGNQEAIKPNLAYGMGENIPFPSGTVGELHLESSPIRAGAGPEINRVLGKNGKVILRHPEEAAGAHQSVIDAVGGTANQTMENGMVTTTITRTGSP